MKSYEPCHWSLKYPHGQNSCIRLHRYPSTARIPADTPPGPETSLAVQTGLAWARRIPWSNEQGMSQPINSMLEPVMKIIACCLMNSMGGSSWIPAVKLPVERPLAWRTLANWLNPMFCWERDPSPLTCNLLKYTVQIWGYGLSAAKQTFGLVQREATNTWAGNPTVWSTTGRMSSFVLK